MFVRVPFKIQAGRVAELVDQWRAGDLLDEELLDLIDEVIQQGSVE